MAAYDIKSHLKSLRVETGLHGRGKGRRRDPFATGFEDDSDDDLARRSRPKTKAPPVEKPAVVAAPAKTSVASPFAAIDALRDSDDDFLDTTPKRLDRRPSPAPAKLAAARRGSVDPTLLPRRDPRAAVALAAGDLAYLDDSSDDDRSLSPRRRSGRGPSPAPRKSSDSAEANDLPIPRIQPPRHTVASPFAGTKYLEDSESGTDDEEAVTSRQGSTDSASQAIDDEGPGPLGSTKKHLEIKRVDKKGNGSGVSWRAFSASRIEQRTAELDALSASLRHRGKSISFGAYATTDDGKRVPVPLARQKPIDGRKRIGLPRGKSPPRRAEDTKPTDDEIRDGQVVEIYDPAEFKTSPFTGEHMHNPKACRAHSLTPE